LREQPGGRLLATFTANPYGFAWRALRRSTDVPLVIWGEWGSLLVLLRFDENSVRARPGRSWKPRSGLPTSRVCGTWTSQPTVVNRRRLRRKPAQTYFSLRCSCNCEKSARRSLKTFALSCPLLARALTTRAECGIIFSYRKHIDKGVYYDYL